jgi:predicted Ser/Thr protein kinase
MPKPKQHQEKADHCKNFLSVIPDDFSDWKAIVAFYSALHLIEKLRGYDGEHSTSHDDRDAYVRKHHSIMYNSYHQLFNASLDARYKTKGAFTISAEDVQKMLVNTYLAKIEKYVADETLKRSSLPPTSHRS